MKILFILALLLSNANPLAISAFDKTSKTDNISLQDSSNPKDYLTVSEEIKAGLNPAPNNWEYSIFITNSHPTETISVRYQLQGRFNSIHTVEVGPSEKKFIIGYNTDRPRSVSIVGGKFVER